jgi:tetratricopeptide (TPR) repeat protein
MSSQEITRIEQTYIEALESFYLGHWEGAQRLLEEVVASQPDHEDAATKLEIARRKIRQQSCDAQAVAAEKAGDWNKAIEALEELLAEDSTSTDAALRLDKARKQKRLAELYAQAQRLMQAEKWQAVLEILREIDTINPRNPDSQGLRAIAEKKLAKTKKDKELETAYEVALASLDAGQWQGAVRHLRRVRGLQAGYRESESLLRRAESEIERAKNQKRVPKPIIAGQAPASPSLNYEWLALMTFGLFGTSRFLIEVFSPVFDQITYSAGLVASMGIYMPIFGALLGISSIWLIRLLGIKLTRKENLLTIAVMAITMAITMIIATAWSMQSGSVTGYIAMFSAAGAGVGIIFATVIHRQNPAFGRTQILVTVAGWVLAFFVAQSIQGFLFTWLADTIHNDWLSKLIFFSLEAAIAGLIGSLILFSQLDVNRQRKIYWLTAVACAFGFGLGNLVTNILIEPWDETALNVTMHMLIWGLIGGASLAVPSKNYKHYLNMGILGGIGMVLGRLVWMATGELDAIRFGVTALILGLVLGVATKRLSAALILSLIASIGFLIRSILTDAYYSSDLSMALPVEYAILALTAGLTGLIIGAAWSFLTPEKPSAN